MDSSCPRVARHPRACLAAIDDLGNAGWLDRMEDAREVLSPALGQWLPALRSSGAWTPEIDRRLLTRATESPARHMPLSVCVYGWDAIFWPSFDLLVATLRATENARVYAPLPRGTSEAIQQSWLDALEAATGGDFDVCESSGFPSSQADLVGRLEGTDLAATHPGLSATEPELLVGVDATDQVTLARDFVARWLAARPRAAEDKGTGSATRLVILCPCRNASAVGIVRALADANIAIEDELGEIPEPSLSIQIQRAILDYHQDDAGLESLVALIELLNEYTTLWAAVGTGALRRVFPLDPVETRRALHKRFRGRAAP